MSDGYQHWPGATLAELKRYLDLTYGPSWFFRDGLIYVYGDQDGARYKRWWPMGRIRDFCREAGKDYDGIDAAGTKKDPAGRGPVRDRR